jgi:hypothetical protein
VEHCTAPDPAVRPSVQMMEKTTLPDSHIIINLERVTGAFLQTTEASAIRQCVMEKATLPDSHIIIIQDLFGKLKKMMYDLLCAAEGVSNSDVAEGPDLAAAEREAVPTVLHQPPQGVEA